MPQAQALPRLVLPWLLWCLLPGPAGAAARCPQNGSEWDAWRRQAVDQVRFPFQGKNRFVGEKLAEYEVCANFTNGAIRACLKPLLEELTLVKQFKNAAPDKQLGTTVSDAEYMRTVDPLTAMPPELAGNPSFMKAFDNPKTAVAEASRIIGELNQKRAKEGKEPILAVTRTVKGHIFNDVTDSNERFVFMVPGDPVKYLSVALPGADGTPAIEISSIAVKKSTPPGGPPKAYFIDYERPKGGGPPKLTEKPINAFACVTCHKNGPIAFEEAMNDFKGDEENQKRLAAINRSMVNHGLTETPFSQNSKFPLALGPAYYGPEARARRPDDMMENCFANAGLKGNAEAYENVRAAMNCMSCHDGKKRQPVTPPFGHTAGPRGMAKSGRMPPGNDLTENERKALGECLVAEYGGFVDAEKAEYKLGPQPGKEWRFGRLYQSLLSTPCESASTASPPGTGLWLRQREKQAEPGGFTH